jgi:hypothetical protein
MPKNTGRGSSHDPWAGNPESAPFYRQKLAGGAFGKKPWWKRIIERYKS